MKVVERDWNWWGYFWRVLHRQRIRGITQWDKKVVQFSIKELGCTRGQTLLDLGCGSGEHTLLLARKGVHCTGIEIAPSLVQYARKQARLVNVKIDYRCMDMKNMAYNEHFDFCTVISGTFGFFSDRQNQSLLRKIQRALRPGGKLLLDIRNARYPRGNGRSWMQFNRGYLLTTSTYDEKRRREHGDCLFIDKAGRVNIPTQNMKKETIRLYTLTEMRQMLHKAHLKYLHVYCGFRLPPEKYTLSYKHNIVIIAEKP